MAFGGFGVQGAYQGLGHEITMISFQVLFKPHGFRSRVQGLGCRVSVLGIKPYMVQGL